MCSDLAIKVSNVSKHYQVYEKPVDRLKQSLLRGKRKYYTEFKALDNISFEVKKGETVGIIGRNGSGKSTLLQMICGTLTPTSGEVKVHGRVAALLELGAGFNPEFTGRENVYMNASILGLSKQETDAKYDDIVAFADIGEYIGQPVKTYSSGMYVRLAFSVIAHADADILIIDEALSVGDAFFVQKCMRFLRNFMKQGTILFVSHDTGAVVNLCDKAILLDSGLVKMSGTPKDVSEKYLESMYIEKADSDRTHSSKTDSDRADEKASVSNFSDDDYKDARLDYVNQTNLRNDLEVFKFRDDSGSFGEGGARIESVTLLDSDGMPMSWIVGGEMVTLEITCKAITDLNRPIVGFFFKDKLGQNLFGDNSFLTSISRVLLVPASSKFLTIFEFRMPVLPVGHYSFAVAIAEGTQQDHIQHHWVHDALVIVSHSSSVCQGLIGIPMKNIEIKIL